MSLRLSSALCGSGVPRSRRLRVAVAALVTVAAFHSAAAEVVGHRPQLLASFGASGVRLHDGGLALLRSLEGPTAVVGVSGTYRTGKSTLLNRLAEAAGVQHRAHDAVVFPEDGDADVEEVGQSATAFATGNSVEPVTDGLYVQHLGTNVEGVEVLLMDTPGLSAPLRDESLDSDIFVMTSLLSSVLVYNSFRVVDTREINELASIAVLASKIAGLPTRSVSTVSSCLNTAHSVAVASRAVASAAGAGADDEQRGLSLPHLLWLVRDAELTLGPYATATDWLHAVLKQSDAAYQQQSSRRKSSANRDPASNVSPALRTCSMFSSVSSLMLSPPTAQAAFSAGIEQLLDHVMHAAVPRRIAGYPATGVSLASSASAFVEMLNKLDQFPGSVSELLELVNTQAVSDALAAYKTGMNKFAETFPQPASALQVAHSSTVAKAAHNFEMASFGDHHDVQPHKERLIAGCVELLRDHFVVNNDRAIGGLLGPLSSSLLTKFEKDFRAALPPFPVAAVTAAADGPRKAALRQLAAEYTRLDLKPSDTNAPYLDNLRAHLSDVVNSVKRENELQSKLRCVDDVTSFAKSGVKQHMMTIRTVSDGINMVDARITDILAKCAGPHRAAAVKRLRSVKAEAHDMVKGIIRDRMASVQLYLYLLLVATVAAALLFAAGAVPKWLPVAVAVALGAVFMYGLWATPDVALAFVVDAPQFMLAAVLWVVDNFLLIAVILLTLVLAVVCNRRGRRHSHKPQAHHTPGFRHLSYYR